ncbi:hypothetical protein VTI74DRAFT_7198 [Chaetomium olivicolor]
MTAFSHILPFKDKIDDGRTKGAAVIGESSDWRPEKGKVWEHGPCHPAQEWNKTALKPGWTSARVIFCFLPWPATSSSLPTTGRFRGPNFSQLNKPRRGRGLLGIAAASQDWCSGVFPGPSRRRCRAIDLSRCTSSCRCKHLPGHCTSAVISSGSRLCSPSYLLTSSDIPSLRTCSFFEVPPKNPSPPVLTLSDSLEQTKRKIPNNSSLSFPALLPQSWNYRYTGSSSCRCSNALVN